MISKKIAIATLGCKVNQYDSVSLIDHLVKTSYAIVPFSGGADIFIINTCTVTARTDYQSRQLIRRANRLNPAARIIVTGCYAQRAAGEIAGLPGVALVAGNSEKDDIPHLIGKIETTGARVRVRDIRGLETLSERAARSFMGRTRAILRIQDGCDSFCTYCIVPYTRGRSRSLSETRVHEEIATLCSSGYREIVLSGIHLGMYGQDLSPPTDLPTLLRKIDAGRGTTRIRLSSIEPLEITPELISRMQTSQALCRHLHIPLQSADDRVLKSMGRHYGHQDILALFEKILNAIPDIAIGVDLMVGFPGEDDGQFLNTFKLVERLPVAYLHVFPYSRRPGTPAANFPDQVKEHVKKERAALLRNLGKQKRQAFAARFVGEHLSVLVESKPDRTRGFLKGFSNQYLPVLIRDGSRALLNRIVDVWSEEACDGKIIGRVSGHG